MKLSEFTVSVLKNFSTINSGLVLKPGKFQRTISADKTILAEVNLDEDFTHTFGIYDLNQFIGNISAMNDPELTFDDKMVVIEDESFKLRYYSCQPELIISPPDKALPDGKDVKFQLKKASLNKILTLASLNSLPNLSIVVSGGEVLLLAHDKSNDSSIEASTVICETDAEDFRSTLKVKNMRIIPGDYEVSVARDKFAKFVSQDHELTYFAGLETK